LTAGDDVIRVAEFLPSGAENDCAGDVIDRLL